MQNTQKNTEQIMMIDSDETKQPDKQG